MCGRSRTSCSRPRLSLVSLCRACGLTFGVWPVLSTALVPRFPWPSRSFFLASFAVVDCVPAFCFNHLPAWATAAPNLRSPWKFLASGSVCLVLPYVAVGDFVQDLSARPQVLLKSSGLIHLLGLLLQVDLRPLVLRCLVLVASLVLGLLAARLELSWMPEFLGSSNHLPFL